MDSFISICSQKASNKELYCIPAKVWVFNLCRNQLRMDVCSLGVVVIIRCEEDKYTFFLSFFPILATPLIILLYRYHRISHIQVDRPVV
jgi:hypothetical protein